MSQVKTEITPANEMANGESGMSVRLKPSEAVQNSASSDLSRTPSGGIQTNDGTLYVSKPFRQRDSRRLRAVISFVPRPSLIDKQGANEFRGFYTLFWISLFLLVVQNYLTSFEKNGYPIELAFAAMFSRDATTLAISDGILVLSTFLSVPFVIAIKNNAIKYYYTGVIIQAVFQLFVLVSAITWTFNRKWPWVQSGFLTLHTIVMMMKVHSYVSTNGYLQRVRQQHSDALNALHSEASRVGGWDTAIAEAREHVPSRSDSSDRSIDGDSLDISNQSLPKGATRSYIDADMAMALRNRLMSIPEEKQSNDKKEDQKYSNNSVTSNGKEYDDKASAEPDYNILIHHPDEEIASKAQDLVDLDAELTSTGKEKIRWPDNISLWNYADYLVIPTLVYELEYPRTEKIRPLYVFERTVATFGTFALLYTITENFILPLVPTKDQSFFRSLLDLALPFMIAYLLLFYIIFECICNGFAELSRFADRQFYEDWVRNSCYFRNPITDYGSQWNATSWDEFARKWNKPVHQFLLRHVYASTLQSYKISKSSAMFFTFLLSAIFHELVMAIVTKKIRLYLFFLQIIQIPLIAVGRIPAIKRNKILGNVVFWLGLYAGFPLLCVAYCAY